MFGGQKQRRRDEINSKLKSLRDSDELRGYMSAIEAARQSLMKTRWEYLRVEGGSVDLDSLGRAGWELVSAVSYDTKRAFQDTTYVHIEYVFKRVLVELPPEAITAVLAKYPKGPDIIDRIRALERERETL